MSFIAELGSLILVIHSKHCPTLTFLQLCFPWWLGSESEGDGKSVYTQESFTVHSRFVVFFCPCKSACVQCHNAALSCTCYVSYRQQQFCVRVAFLAPVHVGGACPTPFHSVPIPPFFWVQKDLHVGSHAAIGRVQNGYRLYYHVFLCCHVPLNPQSNKLLRLELMKRSFGFRECNLFSPLEKWLSAAGLTFGVSIVLCQNFKALKSRCGKYGSNEERQD